ncbi:hypothetical protein D923_00081 [Enterococcus faecalis 06-MB-S-04]|nr:hypothetical protein D923_00081 [Enterococcus faecalis 06-MB-S-04]
MFFCFFVYLSVDKENSVLLFFFIVSGKKKIATNKLFMKS